MDMPRYRATVSALALACAAIASASAQVKTTVPDAVPGARPATVERITIHGKALEGNLEGDAVDRPGLGVTVDEKQLTFVEAMTEGAPAPTHRRPDESLTHW